MERVCIYCERDCSHVPRVKNNAGQYACASCVPGGTMGIMQATVNDRTKQDRAPCPVCGAATVVGIPQCGACGHAPDLEQGSVPRPKRKRRTNGRAASCKGCGYSLVGITAPVCPECGANISQSTKRDWDAELSEEVARAAFRRPLIIGGSALLVAVVAAVSFQSVSFLPGWFAMLALSWFIGSTTCFFVCAFWAGFPVSLPLMALHLAAAHLVILAPLAIVGPAIYFSTMGIIFTAILYAILLAELLDIETFEARIIAAVSTAIQLLILLVANVRGWI